VPLSSGEYALVDEADYWRVAEHSWWLSNGRAETNLCGTKVYMHRYIMLPDPALVVDHANGDPLDNRRRNLRVCEVVRNAHNTTAHHNSRSGYKGVYRPYAGANWQARIMRDGRQRSLGCYADPVEAALAYDLEALRTSGEYAYTNFLRGGGRHRELVCR